MTYEFDNMNVVEVEWVDSNGYTHWQQKDEMAKWAGDGSIMTCRSVGYLLSKSKENIVLVQSESPSSYGDGIMIPKVSITKITYLKRSSE